MAARISHRVIPLLILVLLLLPAIPSSAAVPANDAFQRTWARTDLPTSTDRVRRTWMWGPEAFTNAMTEDYAEAPEGQRVVQYFDKSRMEITNPDADKSSPWYVTNGLLVVEMVTGRVQYGDAQFASLPPAMINIAGDLDDTSGLTYATIAALRNEPSATAGALIVKRSDRAAIVKDDPSFADYGVRAAHRVTVPGIDHQIAEPFWEFMNSSGLVFEDGVYRTDQLFEDPFYATGYPIAEAYWATIKVAGRERDVLTQCFERRCLTYTPDNPEGWQVEAGNVGQHYYQWRYQTQPGTQYTLTNVVTLSPNYDTQMYMPRNVLVTRAGDVYVSDSGNNRIQQYSSQGVFTKQWGYAGASYGSFSTPGGLAEDSHGNIFVADTGNARIQRFDSSGNFQKAWSATGLIGPYDVSIDADDNLFVVDRDGESVWKFDTNGTALAAWGGHGSATGKFNDPRGLGLDADGNVYVADRSNSRVQVFDNDGTFLRLANNDPQALLYAPDDVAIGASGDVYVLDESAVAVTVYGSDGLGKKVWYSGSSSPQGIAIDADGDVWLASAGDYRVVEYSADGVPRNAWSFGSRGTISGPVAMAVAADGTIFVVDGTSTAQVFGPDGTFLSAWGGPGVFWALTDIELDPYGDVWVVDAGQHQLIRYHPVDGSYARMTETFRLGTDYSLGIPAAIAFDADDHIYIADQANARIVKLTRDGELITDWGSQGQGDGQFQTVNQIAVHGDSVYVADFGWSGALRLHQFDLNGNFARQWHDVESLMMYQAALAIDADGFVYFADRDHYRIVKFTPSGTIFTTIGEGNVTYPMVLAVAPDGHIVIGEEGALRTFEPAR
ncbi:MAG TPA: NHL repeat-containing protein [Thermomicrobiales bacterium]|nr:NHL repeat-containing protein [Thermomicrobiales bacterium]